MAAVAYPEIAAPSVDQALAGYQAVAPPAQEVPAPMFTLQKTSTTGGAALNQRGPISVQARPSGFTGGCVGAMVGMAMIPTGPAGILLCAFVGNRLEKARWRNAFTVYVKPEPEAPTAVPVKLWKLGETAPLTDTGLRLVLEARNAEQMAIFLERLVVLFRERWPNSQEKIRIKSYAAHMVASMSLDCTLQGVFSELSRQS